MIATFTPGQTVQVADHRHPLYGRRATVQAIEGDAVELATSEGSHWLAASQGRENRPGRTFGDWRQASRPGT